MKKNKRANELQEVDNLQTSINFNNIIIMEIRIILKKYNRFG